VLGSGLRQKDEYNSIQDKLSERWATRRLHWI